MASDPKMDMERIDALRDLCAGIFSYALKSTDFTDVQIQEVTRLFIREQPGILVQFCISYDALGKINGKVHQALQTLLPMDNHEE